MLEDLIKLSKELFEMELIKESLEIDSLIHKLYSVGGDLSEPSYDEVCFNEDESVPNAKYSSLEDLKSILVNSKNEEFKAGISDILIEALDVEDLDLIKEAISEYLD